MTVSLRRVSTFMVGVLMAGASAAAAPITIDFEGVTPPGTRVGSNVLPYTEDGFLITSSGNPGVFHNDIFNNIAPNNGNGNTTSILGWCGACTGAPFTLTIANQSGFWFNLNAIDFGGLITGSNPGPLTVTGFFGGGGSVSLVIDPAAAFATTNFAGFVNLSSATIAFNAVGNDGALDNINVEVVPEPATLALLGLGLAGLRARRRRSATAR